MTTRIIVDRDVPVPMRDGTITRANVYRPGADGLVPAVLVRTPYNKNAYGSQHTALDPMRSVESGLAVVCQDVRGRYASDGDFVILDEACDGYDSVEWVARQPWCDGNVGMTGSSYLGAAQWLAAAEKPPSLRAIIPINICAPPYLEALCFAGARGPFKLGYALWIATTLFGPEQLQRQAASGRAAPGAALRLMECGDDLPGLAKWRPLATLPLLAESSPADWYLEMLRRDGPHGSDPERLRAHYQRIEIPVLNVGGWYDYFLGGTLQNYAGVQACSRSESARGRQRLLIGPWDHMMNSRTAQHDFGATAAPAVMDFTRHQLDFLVPHLTRGEQGAEPPPVRIFVMGENVWRDEDDWPLARSRRQTWYLRAGPSGAGAGMLSPEMPRADDRPDHYLYDPNDPAPTIGGAVGLPGLAQGLSAGPHDQRDLEARPDVLVFTSAALEHPLEVTGPITAVLYAATTAPDTDWIVRLCDVHPDGASRILVEGAIRAAYRDRGPSKLLLEPGAVERYEIDLMATSNLFRKGHRIRVSVTSSSFPYLEPNPGTGHPLGQDAAPALRPALQTIFHDASRPSSIDLSIVPR